LLNDLIEYLQKIDRLRRVMKLVAMKKERQKIRRLKRRHKSTASTELLTARGGFYTSAGKAVLAEGRFLFIRLSLLDILN
jgi:hypothetical protein